SSYCDSAPTPSRRSRMKRAFNLRRTSFELSINELELRRERGESVEVMCGCILPASSTNRRPERSSSRHFASYAVEGPAMQIGSVQLHGVFDHGSGASISAQMLIAGCSS